MKAEKLWNAVCQELKQDMEPISYRTWIEEGVDAADVQENCLVLEVKSEIIRDCLQKRYIQRLRNAVSAASGSEMEVRLHLPDVRGALYGRVVQTDGDN